MKYTILFILFVISLISLLLISFYGFSDRWSYSSDKEGFITFYGYYRVEDKPPPYEEDQKLEMHRRPIRYSQSLPKKVNLYVLSNNDQKAFIIEIYKRIFHDEPDQLLNKQTIYFRILERF